MRWFTKEVPEPPPPPYPHKELKDKCPVCGCNLKENAFCGLDGESGQMAYTCMNCWTTEGREVIQRGYEEYGFFRYAKIPPLYGNKVWTFRESPKLDKEGRL